MPIASRTTNLALATCFVSIACARPSALERAHAISPSLDSTRPMTHLSATRLDPSTPTLGSPSDAPAIGYLDGIDAQGVAHGWALTPARVPGPTDVAFYADGPKGTGRLAGAITADRPRSDVNRATGFLGDHGFDFTIPDFLRDGNAHQLYAYALSSLLFYTGNDPRLQHRSGAASGSGWATDTTERQNSYITFGPYVDQLPAGAYLARFELEIDDNHADAATVASLDVNDATRMVLARRDLARTDFSSAGTPVHFDVPFVAESGAKLEFRVLYHCCAALKHVSTAIFAAGPRPPSVLLAHAPVMFALSPPHVDPASVSITQLRDLQGDLMLWIPALKPSYLNGVDPVTGMLQVSDNGTVPSGIAAGWIWTLTIDRYPRDKREVIYQTALAAGYTHFAIQVTECSPGPGYHGLIPVTDADCQGHDDELNTILHELWDHGLIPLCTGVSPTDPVAPGLDKSLCRLVLNDWDNSNQADCHVKALADTFPNAQIIFELPSGSITPAPDACSPSPFPTSGGDWIRQAQQRYPNFFAVGYEINQPDGLDANATELASAHAWWRDLQEVRFETDTYWKFWNNLDVNAEQQYNDALQARVPWLKGFMSGGTTHPRPTVGMMQGGFSGELDLAQATLEHMAPDFASWPITTHITRVDVKFTGVHIELDSGRPDSWPDTPARPGMGPLLYSLGMAELINGQWYASAPVQLWRGLDQSGGAIQSQDIGDGTMRGQIQANWFYDGRWGQMQGYQPKPGEVIGLFICAGDCRDGNPGYSPVHERSNVVLIPLPAPTEEATIQ
jgi:hypothetical protein